MPKKNRTGKSAEYHLMNMLKGKKNKHAYASRRLADFSRVMNTIIKYNSEDTKLTKYLLKLVKAECVRSVKQSTLDTDARNHLINAIKARYMKKLEKVKNGKIK